MIEQDSLTTPDAPPPRPSRTKQRIQIVVGLGLGSLLTWLLFRGTDWVSVGETIRSADPGWLLVSQVLAWASNFLRVQRWSYVVRAAQPTTFRNLFRATTIGFLVNFSVPVRMGEMVRAWVLARLDRVPFPQCLSLVALDRMTDLFGLLPAILVAVLAFPASRDARFPAGLFHNAEPLVISSDMIQPASFSVLALLLVVLAVLLVLYFRQRWMLDTLGKVLRPLSAPLAEKVQKTFGQFAEGMHVFRSLRDLALAAFFSFLTWGTGALALAAILWAFGIDFPWYTPVLMLALIAVLISVPVAPGMIGQYHLAVIAALCLAVPDTDPVQAKTVSLVTHFLSLVPVFALGVYSLIREHIPVSDLAHQGASAEREEG